MESAPNIPQGPPRDLNLTPPEWVEAFAKHSYPDEELPEVDVSKMGVAPSYRYKLEESKRVRALARQVLGVLDPIHDINDKLTAYEFADRHGIDHPRVYASYPVIDLVEWDELPSEFVLKARLGANNRAVLALVRQDDGTFWDLLRSRSWTRSEIIERQLELDGRGAASMEIFVEELIRKDDGSVADDWKFYCFDGRVALAMQRDLKGSGDHRDWRFRFWDRDWNDLGPIKFVDRLDPTLPPPRDPEAMLELAERVSRLIGRPFIRIDLFESDRGPLLGEFTPAPGPPEIFSPEADAILGRHWEEAEARLFARQVMRGDWDHLRVEGALRPSPGPPRTSAAGESRPMATAPLTGPTGEAEDLVRLLRETRKALAAETEATKRAEEQIRKLEAKLEYIRSVRDDLRHRLEARERELKRLRRQSRNAENIVEAQSLARRLEAENRRLREAVAALRERRDTLDYRLRVAEWKIEAITNRRWWRLGVLITSALREPVRLLRFPIDLIRLISQRAPTPPRPSR